MKQSTDMMYFNRLSKYWLRCIPYYIGENGGISRILSRYKQTLASRSIFNNRG